MSDPMQPMLDAVRRVVAGASSLPCPYCGVNLMAHTDPGVYVRCEAKKIDVGVASPRIRPLTIADVMEAS